MFDNETAAYSPRIRDLPLSVRPRERLREVGPSVLSEVELLAILLSTGRKGQSVLKVAENMVASGGGLSGLAGASHAELCEFDSVGDAKACTILSALELGKRALALRKDSRVRIGSPLDVYNLLGTEMAFLDQESLKVLLLNTKNEVLSVIEVYKGTVDSSLVRVSEVLRPAIRENCPSIIIVHNHPSGDPAPSGEDIAITRRIKEGGDTMDIKLLDHIVIGMGTFVSMKDRGLGFD